MITAAAAANTVRSTKLMAILKQKDDFPEHQQNKINDLVGEFLQKLRNDVHKTITAQDADTYTGLDSKRDTKQQVRTMLRISFPSFRNNLERIVSMKVSYKKSFQRFILAVVQGWDQVYTRLVLFYKN